MAGNLKSRTLSKRLTAAIKDSKRILADAVSKGLSASEASKRIISSLDSIRLLVYAEIGNFVNRIKRIFTEDVTLSEAVAILFGKNVDDSVLAQEELIKEITKLLSDSSALTDAHALDLAKQLSDQANIIDLNTLDVAKVLSDSAAVSEQNRIDLVKALSDAATVAETTAKAVGKPLSDGFTVQELAALQYAKSATDSAAITDDGAYFAIQKVLSDTAYATDDLDGELTAKDDQIIAFNKITSDSILVSELFLRVVSYTRSFADSAVVIDTPSKGYSTAKSESISISDIISLVIDIKQNLSDAISVAESLVLAVSKALSEQAVATDVKSIALGRPLSDDFQASEIISKGYGLRPTENLSASSNGSLRSQGYCDFTYFAEDYVGTSRTFS